MKKWNFVFRKVCIFIAAAVISLGGTGSYAMSSVQAKDTADAPFSEEKVFALDALPDNDELLSGYLEQLSSKDKNTGISALGIVGDKMLTDENAKKLYKELKAFVGTVANGTRTSAIAEVNGLSLDVSVWEKTIKKVMNYLQMDCPYELYWFDKNLAVVSASGSGHTIQTIGVSFTVAKDYRGKGIYKTNSSKIRAAKKAVSNAKAIVKKHASESDRSKLNSYCKEICNLVSYNTSAVYNSAAYGNPWQLIWVFDKNTSTNVVCEGYAKAFQYLCDLSSFKNNTVCYTVTGTMKDGRNSGNHMWNIVTLNGVNYLADITNCDGSGVGSDGSLFLATPKSGSVAANYKFSNSKGRSVTYIYNSESKKLLGQKILKLGSTSNKSTAASVILSLNGQKLKSNTTLKATFNKKYSFKAAVTDKAGKPVAGSGGNATWSTSSKSIATVNSSGKVTVKKKAGTVTITAKTTNGKTSKIKLKVSGTPVKVTKVKITGSKTMNLKKKKTQTLKAAVTPASAANQNVTWKSSNKKVASVSSKGKVTAKKAGTVTITAAAKDGSKKKAAIKIKVTK